MKPVNCIHSHTFNIQYNYQRYGIGFCKSFDSHDNSNNVYFQCYENENYQDEEKFKEDFSYHCFLTWFKGMNIDEVLKFKNRIQFLYANSMYDLFLKLEDHFSDICLLKLMRQMSFQE